MKFSAVTKRKSKAGFTLTEVIVAAGLMTMAGGGIVSGYIQMAKQADWSAHSLAAQALAMQRVEQARAAKWDRLSYPPIDQLVISNFPPQALALNLPFAGTNTESATDYTSITDVSANPPLRMIQVDCVWMFSNNKFYTNTVVTYRAPDQ